MRPLSKLAANLTKTASASGLQFVITLLTTPLMTRLYAPQAYAEFGIINNIATAIVGIGLLTLPAALAGEKNTAKRDVLVVALLSWLTYLVAALLIICAMALSFPTLLKKFATSEFSILLLPLLVLTYGIRMILVNLNIERGAFNRTAIAQIIEPVFSRGGSIMLGGMLGGNPAYILLSVMLGQLVAIRIYAKHVSHTLLQFFKPLHFIRSTFRKYSDFIFYNTVSQQMQPLAMLAYQALIAYHYSGAATGYFMLAISILTMPASLIALATAPVTYHHFSETNDKTPQQLPRHFMLLTALYSCAAALIFLPIYIFGEELFAIAFGSDWRSSGQIASQLCLAQAGFFVTMGIQSVLMATRRLKYQFVVDAVFTFPTVAVAAFCFTHYSLAASLTCLSILWCFRHMSFILVCLYSSYHPRRIT